MIIVIIYYFKFNLNFPLFANLSISEINDLLESAVGVSVIKIYFIFVTSV